MVLKPMSPLNKESPAAHPSGAFQKFAEFNLLHLRITLDNYFRVIFGHMTADALKVNESQNSCMLLTNKGIYLIEQFTKPCCCLHCLVKNQ